MGSKIDKIKIIAHSRKGKNALTFLAFVVLSAVLWVVQSLNEDMQREIRCKIEITNVPDTLTRISPIPDCINISVRAQGTQLMKYWWRKDPTINIDYRHYKLGTNIVMGDPTLKALFRNWIGGGAQIMSVTPDSLSIFYTSQKGVRVPVRADVKASASPQYVTVGRPTIWPDTVSVYAIGNNSVNITSLTTSTLNLTNLTKSQIVKVALNLPRHLRAVPDSVEVKVNVEPLISKTRKVNVTSVNTPENEKLIPIPSQIEVYYMVPLSVYKKSTTDPKFSVQVDYRDTHSQNTNKIPVTLSNVPRDFTNVFLEVDSVEYLIEKQ